MPGHSVRHVRPPAVAGVFYPDDPEACRAQAKELVGMIEPSGSPPAVGAIVPHAGWMCSGAVAGEAIAALAGSAGKVDAVVVFGAIHTPIRINYAALDGSHDAWAYPGDVVDVVDELTARLLERGGDLFADDPRLHRREHAVEVELPLIRAAWPDARLLAIETPADSRAVEIGRRVVEACSARGVRAVYLASSDLTHYGPAYDFTPAGEGQEGVEWAMENDRRLLRIVTEMRAEAVVPETRARFNACGGGAIAAMLAAARELGARSARVLRHTNSEQVLARWKPGHRSENAVGYASVIVA